MGTYVYVYRLHKRFWPTHEPDTNTGRKNLGETVESYDSAYLSQSPFQREIRGYPRGVAVVEIIVWVIYSLN
jgi:hypothetical protein